MGKDSKRKRSHDPAAQAPQSEQDAAKGGAAAGAAAPQAGNTLAQAAMPVLQGASGQAEAQMSKAPALPWMRVPILIEAGTGVPLQQVAGLDPRLRIAMCGGE